MKYKKVYSASNSAEAHIIQGLLECELIETQLSGENLSSIWGGLQTDFNKVDVLVNEEKYSKSIEIIYNYEETLKKSHQDGKSWVCEACKNINPSTFEICWNC